MTVKTILVVDDKADIRLSLRFLLSNHNYNVLEADSLQQADSLLQESLMQDSQIDLILLDMNYQLDTTSGEEGLAFIQSLNSKNSIKGKFPGIPIIAMTAWSSVDLVVKAMQLGAADFFAKPWDNQAVLEMVAKHINLATIESRVGSQGDRHLDSEQSSLDSELQWHCEAMQTLKKQIGRIAKTNATVLLRGENGTGKTSIAHYIHQVSELTGPFVSVNVAAIPESLFESELFGHKKGAFTDAKDNRVGRFEAAENGTLFLDEVGSLGLEQQAKLLRVLESNEYERVGENKTRVAKCRVKSASNADFDALMASGQFRTDLYFRINPIELTIAPLRERKTDVLPLAQHFINLHCKQYQLPSSFLSESAKTALEAYHWPGNVRELSHFMARAVLMSDEGEIQASDFGF